MARSLFGRMRSSRMGRVYGKIYGGGRKKIQARGRRKRRSK